MLNTILFHVVKAASFTVHSTGVSLQYSAVGLRKAADVCDDGAKKCLEQEKVLLEKAQTYVTADNK